MRLISNRTKFMRRLEFFHITEKTIEMIPAMSRARSRPAQTAVRVREGMVLVKSRLAIVDPVRQRQLAARLGRRGSELTYAKMAEMSTKDDESTRDANEDEKVTINVERELRKRERVVENERKETWWSSRSRNETGISATK